MTRVIRKCEAFAVGRRRTFERYTLACDTCGREFDRAANQMSKHNFCSRECSQKFNSARISAWNRERNKTLMTPEVRAKLRASRLGKGEGKTYTKTYGRHTHRIVAEEMLGRPLRKGEVVHHIDGDKRNNDPSNLMVFASQADHARHHALEKKKAKGGDAR